MEDVFDIAYFDRLRSKKPFIPFRIQTSAGKSHDVLQPLWFAYNGTKMTVIPPGGGMQFFLQSSVVSVRELTSEEVAAYQPLVESVTRRRTG